MVLFPRANVMIQWDNACKRFSTDHNNASCFYSPLAFLQASVQMNFFIQISVINYLSDSPFSFLLTTHSG